MDVTIVFLDIDPWCIFGGYVNGRYGYVVYVLEAICSGQIMSKRRTTTFENCKQILGCSLQVFLPMDFCLFPWLIYKVLHLSPCSNLVLWGAICYTIFSHLSSYPDIEPTSCLVTWTLCLSVAPPHIPKYLVHLCLVIRQVSPFDQNFEMLKIYNFTHCRTLLTVNLRQCRIFLVEKPWQQRFVQFLKIFRDFSRNLEVSKLFPSFVDLGCEIHFSWDLSYPL